MAKQGQHEFFTFARPDSDFGFGIERNEDLSYLTFTRIRGDDSDDIVRICVKTEWLETIRAALLNGPAGFIEMAYGKPEEEHQDEVGVDVHFVVSQCTEPGAGLVFESFLVEDVACVYYEKLKDEHPEWVISDITHRISGVFSKEYVDELKARISQLKLGNQVCSNSLSVDREQIKKLEEENEALKRVIKLTL